MNFSDYWQENKRFVTTVGVGVLLFFVGYLMLDSSLGSKDRGVQKRINDARRDLKGPLLTSQDRDDAESDNEALEAALAELSGRAIFEPRPEFIFRDGEGTASNLYFTRVDEVREALRGLASRARASLPDGLDLEPLMTNDVATIERHLMALDLIDRVLRNALNAGVQSVDRIQVDLDPGFKSKEGVGAVERTRVRFEMSGDSNAMAAMVIACQNDEFGKPVVIDELEAKTDRRKLNRVTISMGCSAISLHQTGADEDLE